MGTIFASCTKAAYLANACALDLIANSEGYFSEILYTALHFVNLAPNLKYSANLSLKPSNPSVTFSSGETIEGGSSGIKATFHQYHSANTTIRYQSPTTKNNSNADAIGDGNTYYTDITTTWTASETITGATSGATATVHGSTAQTIGDIDNHYLSLDESYIGITGIIPLTENLSGSTNMFSVNYQYALNDLYTMGAAGDMKNYVFTQQYLSTIQNLFSGLPRFRFNRHRDRIYLDIDWSGDLKIDDFVVIEAYASMNPETYTDAYSDIFLKKYCTALMKKQWGMNLIKFEGVQLPGGVTLNGRQLYDDAITEIEKLEVEGKLEYQLPDDFYVG